MREGPDPTVCENCGASERAPAEAPAPLPGGPGGGTGGADVGAGGGGEGAGGDGDVSGDGGMGGDSGAVGAGRDRDEEGRARNARPRDGLGRPLPYGTPGVERQPEGIPRTPGQTLEEAQRLLDDGRPFHAHEVLEDAWKAALEKPERPLWRAMAQLAVGVTHAARGNTKGAVALLERAAGGIEPFAAAPPFGIDAAGLTAWARRVAAGLAADGTAPEAGQPPRLRATGATGEGAGHSEGSGQSENTGDTGG
ncbi:DUF309 domain-containing protein [Streptomyces xinghaiensis]|uniref:DUF309 domain-containing protein n=2 Tax=Streptomyces TaxID=1883 RepID=A0A420UZD1_9ACTN|nr:DUF309 domain-containing protein [Streptomyces xinghaiensis]RKM93343.1 DUF309 domain-containing protein [Streptomyces xinghaiensis]RNC71307.1 DUF309 domain-containing protein [Streptomyces xinghaiensis]